MDEVNLNAMLMIGANCMNLQKFCLHGCHFQMQAEDARMVDSICQNASGKGCVIFLDEYCVSILFTGKPKRLRMTSTCSVADFNQPFGNLKSLDVYLTSPTHLPIFQYLVNQAVNLEVLIFDQFFCDFSESLINQSLFEWNSLQSLKELSIGHGSKLSIVTVNLILANCPKLVKLGQLHNWGQVTQQQIASIRGEICARNFDLVIDSGE